MGNIQKATEIVILGVIEVTRDLLIVVTIEDIPPISHSLNNRRPVVDMYHKMILITNSNK